MIVARQIATRYANKGIVAISLNPGEYMRLISSLGTLSAHLYITREHQD